METIQKGILIYIAVTFFAVCVCRGQVALEIKVISSGGGVSAGGGMELHGTLGEPVAGFSDGLRTGFWNMRPLADAGVSTGDTPEYPVEYELYPNYPNPFNPVTSIRYDVPEPSPIRISIYNMLGQRVRILIDAEQPAGRYVVSWDGRGDSGLLQSSGSYIYHLETSFFSRARPMLLLK